MSSIDTRVVEAQFKNDQFGKGVSDTMSSLDKLKASLKLEGADEGSANAARGLSELGNSTDGISGRFSAMSAVAFGALASIGAKAVSVGAQMASSFTTGPIIDGFREYETNMNSIQTILANTSVSGAGLPEVNAALDELNHYSDQTIYNFSEMARNIGTFTAAGVDLQTATGSIKGIANLAALSGSSSEQASSAMYQLSQAISSGKVSLQDWNSVVNAGMGGTVFQRALAQTATQMGALSAGAVTLDGDMQNVSISGQSFRESIDATNGPSWLTSDVLTQTLNQFTGDMSDAELASQGFSAEMIASIQAQAATANSAATQVKTFSQLVDTIKEGIGSGWSQSFRTIIGDFEEAKVLFTNVSNAVGGFFQRQANSRNEMLKGWKDAGGRDALLGGLTDAFWALAAPIAQVGMAFRDIFPKSTGQQLADMTRTFANFMADIQPAPETLDRIRRTFAGVFAILGIGWEVVKALAGFFADLFAGMTEGDNGILKFTASIGDFLVGLHAAIRDGEGLTHFFDTLLTYIFKIINPIRDAGSAFGDFFAALNFGPVGTQLGELISKILAFGSATDDTTTVTEKITGALGNLLNMARNVGHWAANLGESIAGAFSGLDYDRILSGLQVAMTAGVGGVLLKLASSLKNFSIFGGSTNGILHSLSEGLEQVSGTLQSMQNNNNASALLKLAAAIGLLAVSVMLLASIDPSDLVKAAAALGVLFVELTKGMAQFNASVSIMGAAKLNLLAPALILMGLAILIFVGALALLATFSWEELAKGLLGLGLMLGMLAGAVVLMNGNTKGMLAASVGLTLMAVAINILVLAVKQIADMEWESLGQGLAGIAALLTGLALFTRFAKSGAGAAAQGLALLALGVGIKFLAEAVQTMSAMSWSDMVRGLTGMAIGLGIIGAALKLISGPMTIVSAVAVAHVAGALGGIADVFVELAMLSWSEVARGMLAFAVTFGMLILAIQAVEKVNPAQLATLGFVIDAVKTLADAVSILGKLSWDEIIRGITAMIGTIAVLVIALKVLEKVPATAGVALGLVAGSLYLLAPALAIMGGIPIEGIVGALVLLAGVFIILGIAAKLLGPSVPVLLGLGIAIGLLGLALALAGAGVFLFSSGLVLLGAAGAAATAGIVAIVSGLIGLIPLVMEQIGLGLVAFAEVIATAGPAIMDAVAAVLTALLGAFIEVLPKVGEAMLELVSVILNVLVTATPQIIEAGFKVLMSFLTGIAAHIGEVVTAAVDVIVNFLEGIAANIGRIIQAGVDIIVAFMHGMSNAIPQVVDAGFHMIIDTINGIADAIRDNIDDLFDAAGNIASAIIDGIVQGIGHLAGDALNAVKDLAGNLLDGAMDFLGIGGPSKLFRDTVGQGIPMGIGDGIDKYSHYATDSTSAMGNDLISTMGKTISGLGDMVSGMDDFNPVITPVLDLSTVQKDSSLIGDILASTPIDLADTMSKAGDASAGYNANQEAISELVASAGTNVSLTQNNYSPKALSQAEIYRNTNNQLSQARSTLKNAN